MTEENEEQRRWSQWEGTSCFQDFRKGDVIDGIPHGQGIGKILEFERNDDGKWTKIHVRYVSGCMPMSGNETDESNPDQMKLPEETIWIDREELEERWSRD